MYFLRESSKTEYNRKYLISSLGSTIISVSTEITLLAPPTWKFPVIYYLYHLLNSFLPFFLFSTFLLPSSFLPLFLLLPSSSFFLLTPSFLPSPSFLIYYITYYIIYNIAYVILYIIIYNITYITYIIYVIHYMICDVIYIYI